MKPFTPFHRPHAILPIRTRLAGTLAAAVLTACGGGGTDAPATMATAQAADTSTAQARLLQDGSAARAASGPSTAQRIAAASATAQNPANPCSAVQPFYWEIGDRAQRLAAGSVQPAGTASEPAPTYTARTPMAIASASKWLYAAYVVERRRAALDDTDIKFLNFRSGYTEFSTCLPGQTVDSCLALGRNGEHSEATDGRFDYGGGHMQKHASLLGLGALNSNGLANEVQSQIGSDVALAYSQPQPAGGGVTSANAYAVFLRKLLGGQLQMGAALGSHAVCTNPRTCPAGAAVYTPIPASESWHYSLGHWVEDDPVVGDGAFSSPGAFGFYPWIDASRQWYGVLARVGPSGSGYASAQCGRLIRKAWVDGTGY